MFLLAPAPMLLRLTAGYIITVTTPVRVLSTTAVEAMGLLVILAVIYGGTGRCADPARRWGRGRRGDGPRKRVPSWSEQSASAAGWQSVSGPWSARFFVVEVSPVLPLPTHRPFGRDALTHCWSACHLPELSEKSFPTASNLQPSVCIYHLSGPLSTRETDDGNDCR